jgi:hypothetical protein
MVFVFLNSSHYQHRLHLLERLRYLQMRLHSTSSPSLRFRHRPLQLRALAFDVSGVVSLAFNFKFLRIQLLFLPHCFVSSRSRLPWLRFPLSPSTL